jgi:hypothetical protein
VLCWTVLLLVSRRSGAASLHHKHTYRWLPYEWRLPQKAKKWNVRHYTDRVDGEQLTLGLMHVKCCMTAPNDWDEPFKPSCLETIYKIKVKLSLCFNWAPRHDDVLGEWKHSSTHSLTSILDGGEWSASHSGRFTPRERAPSTHCTGGYVGPRAGLDAVMNTKIPSPRRESNPRTPIVQPEAQSLYRLGYHGSSIYNIKGWHIHKFVIKRNLFGMVDSSATLYEERRYLEWTKAAAVHFETLPYQRKGRNESSHGKRHSG